MSLPYADLVRQRRTDLNAAAPLPAPYLLWIDPSSVCNLRCPNCPHGFGGVRNQTVMPMGLWQIIAGQIRAAGWRIKTTNLYGMGEPLWNTHLPEMVAEAARWSDKTMVATNGTILTPRTFNALDDAGLTYLRISCYEAHIADQAAKLREALMVLRHGRHMRVVAQVYEDEPHVAEQMRGLADEIITTPRHTWGHSQPSERSYDICSLPFYCAFVGADGDVRSCLADYRGIGLLGNVKTETLPAIWNGPVRLARERTMLAGGCDAVTPCRWCNGGHNRDGVRRKSLLKQAADFVTGVSAALSQAGVEPRRQRAQETP